MAAAMRRAATTASVSAATVGLAKCSDDRALLRTAMPELQAAGEAKGSVVHKANALTVAALETKVRNKLGL